MTQRSVELLIGRLVTDEVFRAAFVAAPAEVIDGLRRAGHELNPVELAALVATDPEVWGRAAAAVDPRLLKLGR